MRTIPPALIPHLNALASADPFLIFLEVSTPDDTFYLVRNTEDVVLTYDGNPYTAFPFEFDRTADTAKGNIPYLTVRISNVSQAIQAYIEAEEGMLEGQVILRVAHAAHLDEVVLELTYDIIATVCDEQWVTFTLGAPSPLRRRFPPNRLIADFCMWLPGGAECSVAAAAGVCTRRLEDCRSFNNSARFGGRPGMSNPNVRLV